MQALDLGDDLCFRLLLIQRVGRLGFRRAPAIPTYPEKPNPNVAYSPLQPHSIPVLRRSLESTPVSLVAITVVLVFLGVPAMVCAGLMAAASATLMGGSPPPVRLVLALYAWASASMLSVTSGTLTVVASSFGVTLRPLVLGRNLLFIVAFGMLVAVLASFAF